MNESDLRLIEKSFPIGTIYTIYSLNLRYLFKIKSEEEILDEDIKILRLKGKIITWIKARYLQKDFEENQSAKRDNLISIFENNNERENKSKKEQKVAITFFEEFEEHLKTEINREGEKFYFFDTNPSKVNNYLFEFDSELEDKENTLFKILHDLHNELMSIEGETKILDEQKCEKAKTIAKNQLKKLFEKAELNYKNKCNKCKIKKIIDNLNNLHSTIDKKSREKKNRLYSEIRRAETFLASNEFANFQKIRFLE